MTMEQTASALANQTRGTASPPCYRCEKAERPRGGGSRCAGALGSVRIEHIRAREEKDNVYKQ